jgi:hypothetical protein
VVLLAGAGVFLHQRSQPDLAGMVPPPVEVPGNPVAIVLGSEGGSAPAAGSYLHPGRLAQADGWISLQTLHGVSIMLGAPFEATLLSHDRVEVRHGRVRVRVPDGAEGFRLFSPAFNITDLGTEFAASIGADGTGRCRVFEGEADVSLVDSLGVATATRRLRKAESVRIEPSQRAIRVIDEKDGDYPELKVPPRTRLELAPGYAEDVLRLGPSCYWRFESLNDENIVPNEVADRPGMHPRGSATLSEQSGGNHAGCLADLSAPGFFSAGEGMRPRLRGDFTISFFVEFEWLQNYAMVSALNYSPGSEGHPFLLQAYSSFNKSGLDGTGLHAVVRDPPGWNGGTEMFGNTLLRPHFWHHVAVTRRGRELTLLLDGMEVGREQIGDARLDFDYFYVGRLNANVEQPLEQARQLAGEVDELAIFGRALTEDEVRRLAAGKVATPGH